MTLQEQETTTERRTRSRSRFVRAARCIFCDEENVSGLHYPRRHALKVGEHCNLQMRNKMQCKHCAEKKREGNIHEAVRHLAESHPEILNGLGIETWDLTPEAPRRPTHQEALQNLGFSNSYERHRWIEEHRSEISGFIESHGISAARRKYHISLKTAERVRDQTAESAVQAEGEQSFKHQEEIEPSSESQDVLFEGGVLELISAVRTAIGQVLDTAEDEIRFRDEKIQTLEEQLVASEEQKQRIIKQSNRNRERNIQFGLGDLQRLHGRGQDGTRRSFVPDK